MHQKHGSRSPNTLHFPVCHGSSSGHCQYNGYLILESTVRGPDPPKTSLAAMGRIPESPIRFGADIYISLMTKRDSHYVIQREILNPFKAQTSSRSIFERVILIIPKVTSRIVCLGNFFRLHQASRAAKLKLSTLAGSRYLHYGCMMYSLGDVRTL